MWKYTIWRICSNNHTWKLQRTRKHYIMIVLKIELKCFIICFFVVSSVIATLPGSCFLWGRKMRSLVTEDSISIMENLNPTLHFGLYFYQDRKNWTSKLDGQEHHFGLFFSLWMCNLKLYMSHLYIFNLPSFPNFLHFLVLVVFLFWYLA